jgi:hypothetical protein
MVLGLDKRISLVFWGSSGNYFSVGEIGIFVATKMIHLSDDETVAKMGHPIVAVRSDAGHPASPTKV